MPLHREESVSAGTKSIAPVTINRIPVYVAGIPTPTIKDSIYAQSADASSPLIGTNAAANNGSIEAIVIGNNAIVGQVARNDGAIAIGNSVASNAKNKVRIGSSLAFGAGAGDDSIAIGTQVGVGGNASIAIGRGSLAAADGIAIGHTASTNGTTQGIAIGKSAAAANVGVNHESIAIGNSAVAAANNGQTAIAIGKGAQASHALGVSLIAIGTGATANVSGGQQSIAIGAGATVAASNEIVIGDSAGGNHIAIFTIRTAAATGVKIRSGADGSFSIVDLANVNTHLKTDADATAQNMRLLLWDVTAGALVRVSRGAVDSGGVGFRLLRVPN